MPPLEYQTISLQDFGAGVDQLSSENAIQEGFSEAIVNADPNPKGSIAKRRGYQAYAGFLPLRVTKIDYVSGSTDNLILYFDRSVNLSRIRNTPLIVAGRTSAKANTTNSGDFPNTGTTYKYFPGFNSSLRRVVGTGTSTITIDASEHGFSTDNLIISVYRATDSYVNNTETISPEKIEIDSTTFEVSITFINGGASFDAFVIVEEVVPTTGDNYFSSPISVGSGASVTTTIDSATHQLSSLSLLVYCFEVTSTPSLIQISPANVVIEPDGDVKVTLENGTASSIDYQVVLVRAPVLNTVSSTIPAGTTTAVTVPIEGQDFAKFACYSEDLLSGDLELILPDSISLDITADEASVEITNGTSSDLNLVIYWDAALATSNKMALDATSVGLNTFTDEEPQLAVWGINQANLYPSANGETAPGWSNHIDSYRSAGEARLVAGLGGNLFSAQERSEIGTTALMPLLYPSLNSRTDVSTGVGPAFVNTGDTSLRERGYLEFDGISAVDEDGETRTTALVTSISYESSSGYTVYTLSVPNVQVQGTLTDILSCDTISLEDWLTVTQSEYSQNNGEFKIREVSLAGETLEIKVENGNRDSSDYDEGNSVAEAAVYTNSITLAASSLFIAGDVLKSELFTETVEVLGSRPTTLLVKGLKDSGTVPAGLRIAGIRNSSLIPLRIFDGTASVENLVVGDVLRIGSAGRRFKVKYIRSEATQNLSVGSNGDGTADVTLGYGDTSSLTVGQKILLINAFNFSGEHAVHEIVNSQTFTILSDVALFTGGTLVGNTIEVDEVFDWEDSVNSTISLEVERRWIPIEVPELSEVITVNTRDWSPIAKTSAISHFPTSSYASQPPIKSSMVADNLYLTNKLDDVMKYDGENIYQAGLPRWQAQLFTTVDTAPAAGGTISFPVISATVVSTTDSRYKLNNGEEHRFSVGDVVKDSTGAVYTIMAKTNDGTDGFIFVDRTIAGSPTTVQKTTFVKYYFRLNAVDVNGNVIASAVTGSEDSRVDLSAPAQIRLKGVALPPFGHLDYSRLEVEIYRTKVGEVAPFYRCTTIPLSFYELYTYFTYTDSLADDAFAYPENLDKVSSVLMGQKLGTTWSRPLRSKVLTSAGNRLVTANIRSYPQVNVRFVDVGVRIASLHAQTVTLRKDASDTGTTSDVINRLKYTVVTSGHMTITSMAASSTPGQVTITRATHGVSANTWVYLFHNTVADGNLLTMSGLYRVQSVTSTTFDVIANIPSGYVFSSDDVTHFISSLNVPVWMGTDGNYATRTGQRVASGDRNTVSTSGPNEFIYCVRLANMVNASMRAACSAEFPDFVPWVTANAGSEYFPGQIVFEQPLTTSTPFSVELWQATDYRIFANDYPLPSNSKVSSEVKLFPSRVLASFENYPEIFDNPLAIVDTQSRSAIDVNSADGQEITAIIPFFGESAFGASAQGSVIVAFKENSIYLVDLAAKARGENAVQRIDSGGVGCSSPASVASSGDGIFFAHVSGVYKLTRQLKVEEQGRYLARFWRDQVGKSDMELLCANSFATESTYRLSTPAAGEAENSLVLSYNATREYSGQSRLGSWTTYNNYPATVWCNLDDSAFFGSTSGEVFVNRALNETSDYRDDSSPISMEWVSRSMDFGDSGIRKAIYCIIVHYRQLGTMLSTKVYTAVDLRQTFQETDQAILYQEDGAIDLRKVLSVRYSLNDRKGVHLQFKITNDGIDESVEITKIDVRVAGMTHRGTLEAATVTRITR